MDPASSVAGLISLAGLLVQSASFLYRFCSNLRQVAEEVGLLIRTIEDLQALLRHIEEILRHDIVKTLPLLHFSVGLDQRVQDCEKDLEAWRQAMQDFQIGERRSLKKCIRSLKAAADEGQFQKIRLRLVMHYEHLSSQLSILNG